MKILKKFLSFLLVNLLLVTTLPITAFGQNITSYTYNKVGQNMYSAYPSPNPYNYEKSIYADDLGIDSLYKLSSIFVEGEKIYIASGNSIVITDVNFNTEHIISDFRDEGVTKNLTEISGIFVTAEGEIYACEPTANRILHFDQNYQIKRILERPEDLIIADNVAYQPLKVAVDSVGRIYVVANNIYEGIVELNYDGTFNRYFGKVPVKYTAAELFWRSIQTDKQRALSASWLPVNFSNIVIDEDDFVYATVAGADEIEPIRKLNAKGVSILRYPQSTKIKPHGDLIFNFFGQNVPKGMSLLTAIDVNDYGVYVSLDSKRNRIFAYDDDGYMIFAMGSFGISKGNFQNPVDIKFLGNDKLIVADKGNMSIEVYSVSDYGAGILRASEYQYNSKYKEAAEEWSNVLDYNQSFQYAYIGMGKALYREGNYKKAQEYFLLGQDVDYYSMAFKKTRQEYVNDYFAVFIGIVAAVIIIRYLIKRFLRSKKEIPMKGKGVIE